MHLLIGLPMLINLLTFAVYSYLVLPQLFDGNEFYEYHRKICQAIMNAYSLYFFVNESAIIYYTGFHTLRDNAFWLVSSIVSAILILLNTIENDFTRQTFWSVQACCACFTWAQFLAYLLTFEICVMPGQMLSRSLWDILPFSMVFFTCVLLFAGSFHAMDYLQILRGDLVVNRVDLADNTIQRFLEEYFVQL